MTEAFEKWWSEKYAGSWKPQALEDCFKEIARSAWDEALENLKKEADYPNNFLKWAEQQQQEADYPNNFLKWAEQQQQEADLKREQ